MVVCECLRVWFINPEAGEKLFLKNENVVLRQVAQEKIDERKACKERLPCAAFRARKLAALAMQADLRATRRLSRAPTDKT